LNWEGRGDGAVVVGVSYGGKLSFFWQQKERFIGVDKTVKTVTGSAWRPNLGKKMTTMLRRVFEGLQKSRENRSTLCG